MKLYIYYPHHITFTTPPPENNYVIKCHARGLEIICTHYAGGGGTNGTHRKSGLTGELFLIAIQMSFTFSISSKVDHWS